MRFSKEREREREGKGGREHASVCVCVCVLTMTDILLAQAKVSEHNVTFGIQQYILWLEVPIHYVEAM